MRGSPGRGRPPSVPSPLDHQTVRQRLRAARELRGISQDELGRRMGRDKLNVSDVQFIESAGRKRTTDFTERERSVVPLSDKHVWSLARQLGVPEFWFTEPDTDK